MASYNELLALIDAYINQNGVQAITGQVLNGVLRAMVDQLGRGYSIMGAADPTTDPGTPDGPETWFASVPGTYTNFDGIQIVDGELALLSYVPSTGFSKNTIYEGFQTVQATIDGNVGTPAVGVSYANGILSFDFHNMKGVTGDPAGFGAVTASVDSNIGTPSVQVQTSGPDTAKAIAFQFHNLKGETGVTSVLATVDNTSGNPQCAVSLNGQQLVLNFTGLKGAQGDTGSSVDYPFTIVNNLTTDDATQALSAAQGVVLAGQVSQLEHKVDDLSLEMVGEAVYKNFVWADGYVAGTTKEVASSTTSQFCQPILLKAGEKLKYKTSANYGGAVVQAANGNPIAIGDILSGPVLVAYSTPDVFVEYTAEEDVYVVVSVRKESFDVSVEKYSNDSVKTKIENTDKRVDILNKNVHYDIGSISGVNSNVKLISSTSRARYILPLDNLRYVQTFDGWRITAWAIIADLRFPTPALSGFSGLDVQWICSYIDVDSALSGITGEPKYIIFAVTNDLDITENNTPKIRIVTDLQEVENARFVEYTSKKKETLSLLEYCMDAGRIVQFVSESGQDSVLAPSRQYRTIPLVNGGVAKNGDSVFVCDGVTYKALSNYDIKEKNYPFESGSVSGISLGDELLYSSNTARLRIDVPLKNVASVRIVKEGWRIVCFAVFPGTIPSEKRSGVSYGAGQRFADIASFLASASLDFTPDRFIVVIAKDDDSDISSVSKVDDIIQIETLERSLSGRDIVVLGDSSCDATNKDCWARILRDRSSMMGFSGFFPGTSASGWSTDITTPNVAGQWGNVKSGVSSLRPIVIITSGGNEIANLQLSYDETIALCKQTITTPANASEWAVFTLRKIIADKPMARIYLVSNFYASSTETKDEQRRTYREMLRALCDYFSITLIDLTRNSQIRGYLENTSGSPGYHLYTPDGTHATEVNGRYLIYSKIMGFVCREEKDNV